MVCFFKSPARDNKAGSSACSCSCCPLRRRRSEAPCRSCRRRCRRSPTRRNVDAIRHTSTLIPYPHLLHPLLSFSSPHPYSPTFTPSLTPTSYPLIPIPTPDLLPSPPPPPPHPSHPIPNPHPHHSPSPPPPPPLYTWECRSSASAAVSRGQLVPIKTASEELSLPRNRGGRGRRTGGKGRRIKRKGRRRRE